MASGEELPQRTPLTLCINVVVFHTETILQFSCSMQQGQPPTCDRVVTTVSLVRVLDILAGRLEPAPHVTNYDIGPLPVRRMMFISHIGKINDGRVVEHAAVAFGNPRKFGRNFCHVVELKPRIKPRA